MLSRRNRISNLQRHVFFALLLGLTVVLSGCMKTVTLVEKKPYQVTETVESTEEVPASVVIRPFNGCEDDCKEKLEARDIAEQWVHENTEMNVVDYELEAAARIPALVTGAVYQTETGYEVFARFSNPQTGFLVKKVRADGGFEPTVEATIKQLFAVPEVKDLQTYEITVEKEEQVTKYKRNPVKVERPDWTKTGLLAGGVGLAVMLTIFLTGD